MDDDYERLLASMSAGLGLDEGDGDDLSEDADAGMLVPGHMGQAHEERLQTAVGHYKSSIEKAEVAKANLRRFCFKDGDASDAREHLQASLRALARRKAPPRLFVPVTHIYLTPFG